MDTKLLDILACPICKGPLKLSADKTELISKGAGLAYPCLLYTSPSPRD